MEAKEIELSPRDKLQELRNYNDNKPSVIQHFTDPKSQNKFRKNWFTQVSLVIQMMRDEGEVNDPDVIERINQFSEKCTSTRFQRNPIRRIDVQEANELIDSVLR